LLRDINVLTLTEGTMSSGRRSSPVPQLNCLSGCEDFRPHNVQCHNSGSDGVDVQWECKADLPQDVRFGDVTVACEGYDHPDDPYILRGSCGLEYSLEHTRRHSDNSYNSRSSHGYEKPYSRSYGNASSWSSNLFVFALIGLVLYYVWKNCWTTRPDGGGGGGGGNRFGGDFPGGGGGGYGGGYGGGGDNSKNSQSTYSAGGYGAAAPPRTAPGFWSGMLGGGALGYMLGNRNNHGAYGGYNAYGAPPQNAGWFGGGGFSNRGFGGGGFGGGMGGGGTRSASGFGGTRRR